MSRNLLFVTGTRADFGKLEPLAVAARDDGFRVGFVVTGMHMLDRYGLTKQEVHRMAGVTVHEFLNQRAGDPQDLVLAKTILGISDLLAELRPDLVIFHGDRVEALACGLVCATNYIPSAHVEGGEVSGTIDEIFRHCNTKLAAHHFVSSESARRRVMALGEPAGRLHVIGSPELDFHAAEPGVTLDDVRSHYDIPFVDYGIAIFHPVTSERDDMGRQSEALFGTLADSGRAFVVIAPNNDPGSDAIFEALTALPPSQFRLLPSMRFSHFSVLLKNAACMVGNSSAGVREAPFLGIPSLNIGTRQTNRALSESISAAAAMERIEILAFLSRKWGQRYKRHTAYGEGEAARRFVAVLRDPNFWDAGLQKTFHDHA